jgi:glycosyltransferase involved in cell wall biosynthesis
MIKVAMIARSTLFTVKGGDTVQITQTAAHLAAHGVLAEIKLANTSVDYEQYDLLHFFNITRPADILKHIRRSNKPYVVSTILVDYSEYDRHYRKGIAGYLFRLLSADSAAYCKTIARWLLGKDALVSKSYAWKGQQKSIKTILEKAALLLPNSSSEYTRLRHLYQCSASCRIIPNGIDTSLFTDKNPVEKDPLMVLCIARIEGIKNQLHLIRALSNTRFTLFLVGAAAPNQKDYYRQCRVLAGPNIHFIDQLPQEELVAYYRRAKTHVLPSWFETTGLSSLEAGAMGCNIVITDKGDTREYFGDHALYCNPASPDSIYKAVEQASAMPPNRILQQKIIQWYSWQQATFTTMQAYKLIKQA